MASSVLDLDLVSQRIGTAPQFCEVTDRAVVNLSFWLALPQTVALILCFITSMQVVYCLPAWF